MKRKQPTKRKMREFRGDSYEASLTPEELEELHDLVRSEKTITEICAASVPWRDGEGKGHKPSPQTIGRIKARLDLDDILQEIEGTAAFVEETKYGLDALVKGTDAEKVLDRAMMLIGQEVIHRTLKRLNPMARTAAAKLLLKRADQRRVDRRLDMVEAEFKKDGPAAQPDIGLTPEEKRQRMKEILRIN
jgi:hypothetical protein